VDGGCGGLRGGGKAGLLESGAGRNAAFVSVGAGGFQARGGGRRVAGWHGGSGWFYGDVFDLRDGEDEDCVGRRLHGV